jgi:hypothetical protein
MMTIDKWKKFSMAQMRERLPTNCASNSNP